MTTATTTLTIHHTPEGYRYGELTYWRLWDAMNAAADDVYADLSDSERQTALRWLFASLAGSQGQAWVNGTKVELR